MLQKYNTLKIIEVFFTEPTKEHYLMEISRKISLAHTSVKKDLEYLKREELVIKKIQKKGIRNFPVYKANLDNKKFKLDKMIYNLSTIFKSGLINFLEQAFFPKSIVLFGSYMRGEDIEDSDIDIFIESSEKELNLDNFEKKLKRKIQIHFKKNFVSYPKELKNNIINGIVLHGFLEGYK